MRCSCEHNAAWRFSSSSFSSSSSALFDVTKQRGGKAAVVARDRHALHRVVARVALRHDVCIRLVLLLTLYPQLGFFGSAAVWVFFFWQRFFVFFVFWQNDEEEGQIVIVIGVASALGLFAHTNP